jgi:2-keto-4-pentenoate hydratase/2-oxohepta-3-ene-1,7-dioic acid hydratase in catechol pathway
MSYKLLTYAGAQGPRAGILIGDRVLDAEALSGMARYATVLGVLADWPEANSLFTSVEGDAPAGGMALSETKLLAPILYPGQIWGAIANYDLHIDKIDASKRHGAQNPRKLGGRASHFLKRSRGAVIGQDDLESLPYYSNAVDWEVELAVVIGRPASRVSAADALDYVAGYTIANDVSARDCTVRKWAPPDSVFRYDWLPHKGFDGACPMGPWITPAQAIADPQSLDMKLWVNDELMQDGNTKDMIFSVAEQIEEISSSVTIFPGDVILTGTVSGIGLESGTFLKSGDRLRLSIQDIGELRHGFR